ncbi:FMN-dependent NADH-azoreductase [Devosia sp. UYZn731]|uniref:FMN-dependent NADH-azoreductase n=1 Tax=Devosia sp. UYZn731 TaxID=3156345 RepID=UPI0033993430
MKTILHVSCSPRGQDAESYRLSQKIIGHLQRQEPATIVVDRVIGDGRLPSVDSDYALSQGSAADVSDRGSMILSEQLVGEVESADVIVISTPMHNYTVPATLKTWIDHVARARRTFDVGAAGKVGLLRDRQVFIAIAAAGRFSGERARQPDFLTPYLQAILNMIGLHDLTFFSVQGTGSSPDNVARARTRTDEILEDYFDVSIPGA